MLQQAPESKCLPLHSLHGRRLFTKILDSSAPDTSYVPPTAFTKTERAITTLAPPVVHRGMYYDDHQALYHGKPVELATTLWPPESTNYWFPNWKELFHGFLVVQKGQTRQALVADSEQAESNLHPQQQKSSCSPQCFNTQFVHLSSDNANTSIPWVPLCQQSQQHLPTYTNVYQQKSGSPPKCSATQSVHLGFGNTIPSVHRVPLSQQSQQHHLQLYNNNATQASLPISIPYHNGSHLPAERQEKAQAQIGEANKACSSSIQASGMNTHCTIKSPLWLPQGWITEIQMRTTGSGAGIYDKYFKHLASGRRFRSRKDVLHFTSTGKGRAKKKNRGNKLLIHSAGHSLLKTFAHKKLSNLEHSKPFSHSSSDDKHSTYVASSLLLRLSEPGVTDELGLPCKRLNSLCSSDGNQLPAEESAKHKSHELPVQKKAKVVPSETGEDKQASKLCEWLTTPVATSNCSTLNQEILPVSFSRSDVEKAATETADERSVKDLSLRTQTSHRVNQLSKEIQEAQDNMVQMSREVQAAAEKLSREILAAKKDVEFGQDMQVVQVPTESFRVLADKSQAREGCKPKIETFSRSLMTSSIGDLACKPGGATNGLLKPAHFNDFLNTSVICGIPALGLDHTSGVSTVIQPVTCMPETCSSLQMHVNKPTTWLNDIKHPEVQMVKTAHALMEVKTTHGDGLNHGKQQRQTALVESLQKHAVPAVISYQTERSPLTKGDLKQPAIWAEVPTNQTQKLLPIASGSITKAVDAYASTNCEVVQPVDNVTARTYITRSHVLVTSHHSEQPGEVAEPNDARAIRRQTRSMDPPAQTPVTSRVQAPLSHGFCANASVKSNAGSTDISSYGAQQWIGTQETSDSRQGVKYQQIDEIEARRLRRWKFSAVLNPKLDLSRLSPSLTTRQKAKVVEKMKARHARELLATLGKNICRKAVRRKL
ncbi:hypothetical protein L7F22_012756 [Adiantum nelumboides]|nr:hypothetical protein [Adiantum nelumboides]